MEKKSLKKEKTSNYSYSDKEISGRFLAGDIKAFEIFFKKYCRQLIHFSFSYIKNKEAAENIVQEVFFRTWENRQKIDPDLNIKLYLFSGVKMESLKYLRHLKVVKKNQEEIFNRTPTPKQPEERIDEERKYNIINQAIEELPPKCMKIFILSKLKCLKYSEIARILGLSPKTVENQISIALKLLRGKLKKFFIFFVFF